MKQGAQQQSMRCDCSVIIVEELDMDIAVGVCGK